MILPLHKVRLPESVETRLIAECVRRSLESIEDLIPILIEEYFRMWDDLEGGAAILKMDEPE